MNITESDHSAAHVVHAPLPPAGHGARGPTAAADRAWLTVRRRLRLAVGERVPPWVRGHAWRPRTVGAVAVLLAVAVGWSARHTWSGAGGTLPVAPPALLTAAEPPEREGPRRASGSGTGTAGPGTGSGPVRSTAGPAAPPVVVDVGGRVLAPGVRRLPAGSRVADALAAAGGVRPGTDTTNLNRARVLLDGEHLLVGVPGPVPGPAAGSPAPGPGSATAPGPPLSLATATVEQLDALPGVGPVLAGHIVAFRTAHGGFRSVSELRGVQGIGDRRYAELRELVRP
ncbi:helix-hairpin-helix domain-containing protein [Streptomyces sp. BI20]|uniref:helix-hairpin-helix domain-containing protein n=1 Tax=Streptomyces sp. BI20 TaxID=3403460 RepID=UPI003C70CF38